MPTFEITTPEGKVFNVTGDNAQGAHAALMKSLAQSPQTAPAQQASGMQPIDNSQGRAAQVQDTYNQSPWYQKAAQAFSDDATLAADGATFGYAGKAIKAANNALGYNGDALNQKYLQDLQDAKSRAGSAGIAAQIGGAMLPMSKAAEIGVTATRIPGIVGKLLGLSIDGAGYGALDASGHDQNIGAGSMLGAAGGALGQAAGGIASKLLGQAPATATANEIRNAATAAYQKADGLGVVYSPDAVAGLSSDLKNQFAQFGYHPELQPGAKVALGELDRLAQNGNVNLTGLDSARKLAQNAYIPGNKSNNALVGKVVSGIDDLAQNVAPENVITGNPQEAAATLANARSLWSKASKMDMIDTLAQKAENRAASTGSGGNGENALRQNLRGILDNPTKSRGFSPDELAAVQTAVSGAPGQNIMRQLGKFSPVGNGLIGTMEGLSALGASAAGAPMAAPAILGGAAIGTAAKYASKAMQDNNVAMINKVIASGQPASMLGKRITPQQAMKISMIQRALLGGAIGMSQ